MQVLSTKGQIKSIRRSDQANQWIKKPFPAISLVSRHFSHFPAKIQFEEDLILYAKTYFSKTPCCAKRGFVVSVAHLFPFSLSLSLSSAKVRRHEYEIFKPLVLFRFRFANRAFSVLLFFLFRRFGGRRSLLSTWSRVISFLGTLFCFAKHVKPL